MGSALISEAYTCFAQGELEAAKLTCQQVLASSLADVNALSLLGLIEARQGNLQEAEAHLLRATRLTPEVAALHNNLGSVYLDEGKLDLALSEFRRALKLRPRFTEASVNLGEACLRNHDAASALRGFQHVLKHASDHGGASIGVARALLALGRRDEFEAHCRKARQQLLSQPAALHSLATVLVQSGEAAQAADCYLTLLAAQPDNDALCNDALAQLLQADARPQLLTLAARMVEIAPSAGRFNLQGDVLRRIGEWEAAIAAFRQAIALDGQLLAPLHNLAVLLSDLGRHEEAQHWLSRALALQPDCAESRCLLGSIALERGDAEGAIAAFAKVLLDQPAHVLARWNLGLAQLVSGRFAEGWSEFDSDVGRASRPSRAEADLPFWDGRVTPGLRLLLRGEQGVGDEVFFAGVLADVLALGIDCQYEGDRRLVPLLQRAYPALRCHGYGEVDHAGFTAQIAVGSLPALFRKHESDFPQRAAYLQADDALLAQWQGRLAALPGRLKVGIAWRGGVDPLSRRQRSLALSDFAPLLALADIDFVCLQHGEHAAERAEVEAALGVTVHHWSDCDPLQDLDGFAAQIAALDLVISIDNSTVHLASALGVPTWMLLGGLGNWRWLLGRDDSPWYRSLRILRRPMGTSASGQMAQLAAELAGRAMAKPDLALAA
ncbi:tetratricopeptide repeat protein [Chitinimonas sp.]|uniref:tetratricopeptide repeat protein n=1 Tax=Chitinimonas sp. TaxID=1934313 RepID=UPI0035ADCFED